MLKGEDTEAVQDLCAPPLDASVGHVPRSSGWRKNRPDPQRFDASPSPLKCYHRENMTSDWNATCLEVAAPRDGSFEETPARP